MNRPAHHAPAQMTRQHNRVAAFMKVRTAPLHTLTPAMIESIAGSHARKGTADFNKLLVELRATLEHRTAQENARG